MKRAVRWLVVVLAATVAAWWLFVDTPSRGAQRADTIRLSFWGDYQEYRMWQEIVAAFEAENPGIRVKIEYVPGSEYTRKLSVWMSSNTSPDVMLLQDEPFPCYMNASGAKSERPALLDLTDLIAERAAPHLGVRGQDYWPSAWESFGRQEDDGWHQYGLPVFGGNNLIFYNRECFRRAGVPLPEQTDLDRDWTMDQFVDLCRRLTISHGQGPGRRVSQWGFSRPSGWLYWLPFIYAGDADILSPDRATFVFQGERAGEVLASWHRLGRQYGCVPLGGDLGQMGENVAFLTGRVAMVTTGPWAMPFFNDAGVDYGVLLPPLSPTGRRGTRVTWDCVALAGRLRNDPARREKAYRLARFIASQRTAHIIAAAQRSIPAHLAGREPLLSGSDPNRAAKFIEAMEFSRVQPITEHWERMDEILSNAIGELSRNRADSPTAARQTLERIRRDIRDAQIFRLPEDAP